MKHIQFIFAILALTFIACDDDFLNQPPLDRITENDVWSDKNLTDTYLFKIYDRMPWDYLEDFWGVGGSHRDALSDLAMGTYSWTALNNTYRPGNWGTANNTWPIDWWGYDILWKINYSLENIEAAPDNVFTQEERNHRLGELLFMRAYSYFAMAKRYGGVPIILNAQDPETTPEEEYFPSRNTEQEVYDQILSDTQAAFDLLPNRWSSQKGRASKWAAKSLESRAALYAGSIAKYGTTQLDGLVGIPASDANTYYQTALNAAQKIITESGYVLFNKYPDPSENYAKLFLDETEEETIFMKVWIPFEKGHSYDLHNVPYSYRVDWSGSMSPSKQLLDSYEMLDTGLLPSENWVGGTTRIQPLGQSRPSNERAPSLPNNDIFQGSPVESWYWNRNELEKLTPGHRHRNVGKDGLGVTTTDASSQTGFYIRKHLEDGKHTTIHKRVLFRNGLYYISIGRNLP